MKILAVDLETSGMNVNEPDPSVGFQILSIGLIVSDTEHFKPIHELYLEIKYDGVSRWDNYAESMHKLSIKHLEQHGVSEIEAVELIGNFIYEHFGIENKITLLGTNVCSFDIFFLKRLFKKYDLDFKFCHRIYDTFSLGALLGVHDFFELSRLLGFEKKGLHNALTDIRNSLKAFKIITTMWNKFIPK